MSAMATVTAEVPADVLARCEERADRDGLTVADIIASTLIFYATPWVAPWEMTKQ